MPRLRCRHDRDVAADLLTDRQLNRATLDRQLLLRRHPLDPVDAVTHLVGLQAQNPLDPYLALWSRLEDFDPVALGRRVEDRTLVRIVVMRGTIHLVTADDALVLRPLVQPVLDREIARHAEFAPHLAGVDTGPAMRFAADVLADRPRTGTQLRAALAERFPDLHAPALAYAARCELPLVQVPPRGVWGRSGAVTSTPLEAWVGRPPSTDGSLDDLVFRYLGAFGPATVADAAAWSRLTGLREVFERVRPRVRTFRDERGRELFDLPDAPRPDPDVPAPVRILPEYDNALLSHADRSRFAATDPTWVADASGPFQGSVLVDGRVRGIWHAEGSTVVVEHPDLTDDEALAVAAEADRMAGVWHAAAAERGAVLRRIRRDGPAAP